jgi:hypothetical protein
MRRSKAASSTEDCRVTGESFDGADDDPATTEPVARANVRSALPGRRALAGLSAVLLAVCCLSDWFGIAS